MCVVCDSGGSQQEKPLRFAPVEHVGDVQDAELIELIGQRGPQPQRRGDVRSGQAAETWLRCQGLITVSLNHKVLPHLPLAWLHHYLVHTVAKSSDLSLAANRPHSLHRL